MVAREGLSEMISGLRPEGPRQTKKKKKSKCKGPEMESQLRLNSVENKRPEIVP